MDESGIPDPKLLLENNSRLESVLSKYRLDIDSITSKYEKQTYLNLRLQFIISHLSLSLDRITNSIGDSVDSTITDLILDNLNRYLSLNDNVTSEIDANIANQLGNAVQNAISKLSQNKINGNLNEIDYESLISTTFDKYLKSTYLTLGQVTELRNEISRLTKQNDILYRKYNMKSDNTPEPESEPVIESSEYVKLTEQCKELDKALQRSQNQLLSFKMNVLAKLEQSDSEFEKLAAKFNEEKRSHMTEIESLQAQLLEKNDENNKLTLEMNSLKSECDKLREVCKISEETLNDRIKTSEYFKSKNTQLSSELTQLRELLDQKSSGDDLESIRLKLSILEKNQAQYKTMEENLNNAINEIEEISLAFEEKQRQVENFTKMMLKPQTDRGSDNIKIELDNLNAIFQRQLSLYYEKMRDFQTANKLYIEGWNHSYQRAVAIQQERDELLRYLHMSSERNTLLSRQLEDSKEQTSIYGHKRKSLKPGDENKLIVRENAELIKRITCTVCNERFRDHVIIKCGHFFCEPCLDDNIKSRNRRCSQCKINFDKRDIQKIYF